MINTYNFFANFKCVLNDSEIAISKIYTVKVD